MLFKKMMTKWKEMAEESIRLMFMFPAERRYYLWKKAALEAKEKGLTATCIMCDEPIFPGEFVAVGTLNDKQVMAHAGFHYALDNSDPIMCETGAIGVGYWNGKEVEGIGECAAAKAPRTGETVAY
ncbi:MAG: hypothetical protein M1155_01195 [Patescibacteria group bacterium]|nr:hypothetical protein [Patescibacteria group bacterium]